MNAVFDPLNEISREFDRCAHWVQAALDHSVDSHYVSDVKEMCMAGRAQLWPSKNGVVITTITPFPKTKMLQVWLLGGDFQEVFSEWNDVIESWAKEQGCDTLFVNGRKGWERRLKKQGYKFASVVMTKPLEPED